MKRKKSSSKSPSSLVEENVILLDNHKYICILNHTKKRVIIRYKEIPVPIDYIKDILPALFSYIKYNMSKNNKTVLCIWTPNIGYLIEFDMNTYQFVTNTIQNKCEEVPTYFQKLVKRIITSKLTKLDNVLYQHHFQLNNVLEVNNMLWTEKLPDDCKSIVCQVPPLCPILTLGNYQEIALDQLKNKTNLPVYSSFTEKFVKYIIQQNNLKKIITQSKDLITFLMYFKMGFYNETSTNLTISDFVWTHYGTVSIIHEDGSIVKNIDFRKLYFIQDKLSILNLMTAAIKILGLFLLGKHITVKQT